MKKYYYGAWQNFYHLSWSIRFLVEIIILLVLVLCVFRIIRKIGRKLKIQTFWVMGWVWLVTEVAYLIGHNSEWVIKIDDKMAQWGRTSENNSGKKKLSFLICGIAVGIVVVYLLAVFVDLPVSKNMQEYYLVELSKVKTFFQQWESKMSEGYEKYPPLFAQMAVEEDILEETITEEEEVMYVQLNEQGKAGSNIRQTPSLNGTIVGGASEETLVIYQGKFENDGERYWIKVYLPKDDIEGWLSGKLVDSQQLEIIISTDK